MADAAEPEHGDELELDVEETAPSLKAVRGGLLWGFGLGVAAGAAGGFVLLIQDDEVRGASALAAAFGAVLGAVFALLPALGTGVTVAVAAQRCRSARTYRRWVAATVAGWAVLIPLIGLWIYRSFSYDLRDENERLAIAVLSSFLVAVLMLVPMWRSLRRVRDDEPTVLGPESAIPNPFHA